MQLTDIFSRTPAASDAKIDSGKEDVFKKLTEELVRVREENERLRLSQQAAVEERKLAVNGLREMEDTLKLKEGVLDTLEKRIESLESENDRLHSVEAELTLLREDQQLHPLSSSDASHRYDQLAEIFSSLRDTLSCAVCYEPYVRDQAISLLCGHSFCRACFSNWEERHVEAWKLNPHQHGVYPGPDCPECRSKEVRRGKVRIWALEETVRLVDRAVREIEKNRFTPKKEDSAATSVQIRPAGAHGAGSMNLPPGAEEEEERQLDDGSIEHSAEQQNRDVTAPQELVEPAISTASGLSMPELPQDTVQAMVEVAPSPGDPASSFSRGDVPERSTQANDAMVDGETALSTPSDLSMDESMNRGAGLTASQDTGSDASQSNRPIASSVTSSPNPHAVAVVDITVVEQNQDSEMSAEIEEARNLLRPRTPNPYIAVFRR